MSLDDILDERKKLILRAIIDDYIDTAEPIGSRTIARKHEMGLSSATIRNEMADLTEMGYLAQPYTSAGRVPSDKGYRIYVDQLMKIDDLPTEEIEDIKKALEFKINELSQLIRQASAIMSKITKYTSMATTSNMNNSTFKAVQVVPIEAGKALVIVVTNAGVVRNNMVRIPDWVQPDYLIRVSNILNDKFKGLTIEQVNAKFASGIEDEAPIPIEVLMPIFEGMAECIRQVDTNEIYLEGTINIFNHPEFRDVVRAREFLSTLEEKEIIGKILNNTLNNTFNEDINVKIGSENNVESIKDCSIITATYSVGNVVIGSIGIIGPTRMEYPRAISSMNHIRKKINQELKKLLGEESNDK